MNLQMRTRSGPVSTSAGRQPAQHLSDLVSLARTPGIVGILWAAHLLA